jgi:hypothetical protein
MTYNLRSIRPDKPSGQVELSDSAVFINNFESTSTEVIKSIKDLLVSNKNSTPVAAVDSLLNLGAMVYQLGSTSTDIEHMKNSARELANIFEASTEDVIHKFTSKVDDLVHPEQGILNRVAIETVDKTRDSINALFVSPMRYAIFCNSPRRFNSLLRATKSPVAWPRVRLMGTGRFNA